MIILTYIIDVEIEINELTLRSSNGEIAVKVGEEATIRTRLHNTSETSLHQLRQYLFCYQDYQSGTMTKSQSRHHQSNMNTKMVISGSDSICIDQVGDERH